MEEDSEEDKVDDGLESYSESSHGGFKELKEDQLSCALSDAGNSLADELEWSETTMLINFPRKAVEPKRSSQYFINVDMT